MPQNKKHHYVPKFLLRRFSTDKKSINLYNIKSRRAVTGANLANQCYSDYLYGKDPEFEKGMSVVEGEFAKLLRLMDMAVIPPPLFGEAHDVMLYFVLSQHGRTKYAVEALTETWDKMYKAAFGELIRKEGIDPDDFTVGLEQPAKFALSVTMSGYPMLLDLEYKMLVNKTAEEFVISDNPVVFYNQALVWRAFVSNCGMASKGLQIFVPLDSKKTLMLYDAEVYRVGSDRSGVIEIINPRDVYELNTLQFVSALENIYFQNPNFYVDALQKKATPFLRTRKTKVEERDTRESDGSRGKLISNSSEDIRTNLALSFVSLRGAGKKWVAGIRWARAGPVLFIRNKKLLDAQEKFRDACKAGEYQGSEFKKFIQDQIKGREEAVSS